MIFASEIRGAYFWEGLFLFIIVLFLFLRGGAYYWNFVVFNSDILDSFQ